MMVTLVIKPISSLSAKREKTLTSQGLGRALGSAHSFWENYPLLLKVALANSLRFCLVTVACLCNARLVLHLPTKGPRASAARHKPGDYPADAPGFHCLPDPLPWQFLLGTMEEHSKEAEKKPAPPGLNNSQNDFRVQLTSIARINS